MVRKSPEAFRTISEVAEILDVPAHVLRFWESRFTQIKPVKRGGGRRYYRPADIDLLRGIRDLLYSEGMTIKGVQKILRERGQKHVVELGRLDPEADPVVAPSLPQPRPEPEPAPAPAAAPQPAPRRGAAAGGAALAQPDLFAAEDAMPDTDREELARLLKELQALREKMAGRTG